MNTSRSIVVALAVWLSAACSGSNSSGSSQPPPTLTPVATPVGAVVGPAATATVGASGGTLSSPDGVLTLTIPPGALAADTPIGIQPISNTAHGGHGNAYRMTPDGQTFLAPVTFSFTYTDQDLAGTAAEALGAAYQSSDGFWHWVAGPTLDTNKKTVSVSTDHFTDYAYVSGYNLRPGSANVKVGASLELRVKVCYVAAIDPNAELAPLAGLDCSDTGDAELAVLETVSEWAVNGVPGGGAATGTVSGTGSHATYTAPATPPTPSTVSVSARIKSGASTTLLVSSVNVGGGAFTKYDGSISVNGSLVEGTTTTSVHATAEVHFTLSSSTSSAASYDLTSSSVYFDQAQIADSGSICTYPGKFAGQIAPGFMFEINPKSAKYGLSGSVVGTASFQCTPTGGTPSPQDKAIGALIATLEGASPLVSMPDPQHLSGQCEYPAGVTIAWDLIGSN